MGGDILVDTDIRGALLRFLLHLPELSPSRPELSLQFLHLSLPTVLRRCHFRLGLVEVLLQSVNVVLQASRTLGRLLRTEDHLTEEEMEIRLHCVALGHGSHASVGKRRGC